MFGQDGQDRRARTRHLERTVKNTTMADKRQQDCQNITRQDSWDRTTGTGQPCQDDNDITTETERPMGKDRTSGKMAGLFE